MTVSAVSPCRTAFRRETSLPASVLGPVLLSALARLDGILRYEVMGRYWLRFVILRSAMDESSAKAPEPPKQHQYRSCPTKPSHHRRDAARDGDRGTAEP